nr:uncharacterized protein LOC104107828 [Nicotiana tomentosiformis]
MLPYLRIYDGTTDPEDHMTHYVTAIKGNDLDKEQVSSILLKKFGKALTEGALTWYSQLPAYSIETFEEMADKFITAYAGAKKVEARVNDIFAIKQSLGEGLRDFLTRFNRVRMNLPNVSEGMDKIHNAYCAEVRANEDDLNGPTHRLTSVQAESRKEQKDRRPPHPPSALKKARPDQGQGLIGTIEKLRAKVKWLPKMRSDLNTRKSDALCEFHQKRDHKTEVCVALRQEVVNMLRQRNLKELLSDKGRTNFARGREYQGPAKPPSPARTINMIIGGRDDASINDVKFTTTHKLKRPITHERYVGHLKENLHTQVKLRPIPPPVRQVGCKFNSAINDAVRKEVEKLLENSSIRESKYPKWIANVVIVKKKNGK